MFHSEDHFLETTYRNLSKQRRPPGSFDSYQRFAKQISDVRYEIEVSLDGAQKILHLHLKYFESLLTVTLKLARRT